MTTPHNWPVYGHDWAVNFLRKSLLHRRTRHAYLITGAANIGKNTLAHAFAMSLNCEHSDEMMRPCGECRSCRLIYSGNHPDMLYTETDPKTGQLKIDTVRDLMRLIALKPYSSRYRIAVLRDFDHARPQAQDALLKTLEEPPPHALLILLAETSENLMPTITSRCQIVPLRATSNAGVEDVLRHYGADDEQAALLARLSSGRIGWAMQALQDESVLETRDEFLIWLDVAVRGNRAKRFELADEIGKIARKDKLTVRYMLEIWQTYWRDVLLLSTQTPIKTCNLDRRVEIEQLVQRIQPEEALKALQATRHTLNSVLTTNANVRLAMEVLLLEYPGLITR